ncbi:glutathione S-transferase [Primorskyibacter flagellatus]|uniref:Glutathione S-transferase n=1 Tax=Primorskyibacter flagellatus TaxID=1387277 RepID=A0A917EIQ9_9RHOB|nr:glutathione S-transferase family protein [Primorskyibacter flagellatus]GGE47734.1 glutathione S-transferase [Primorskyibacter flagellatus]
MITLYWNPQTRAERMFWLLEEIDEPYRLERFNYKDGAQPSEAFKQASPLRKLPALSDDDVHLADSAAIALYLADRYAMGRLAPALDDPARGPYLYWMFFTPSALEPAIAEKVGGLEPRPTSYPWGTFDRMTGAFEDRLKGRHWIASDSFTMADAVMSSSIAYIAAFKLYEPVPHVADYLARCTDRPSYAAAAKRLEEAMAALA